MVGVTGSIPVAPTTFFKDLAESMVEKSPKKHYSCSVSGFVLKFNALTVRRR
jgi:hypothetical protein